MKNNEDEIMDEENYLHELFTPEAMKVICDVAREMNADRQLDDIEIVYDKIIAACRGYNNGTLLLALAETLNNLFVSASEQQKELE